MVVDGTNCWSRRRQDGQVGLLSLPTELIECIVRCLGVDETVVRVVQVCSRLRSITLRLLQGQSYWVKMLSGREATVYQRRLTVCWDDFRKRHWSLASERMVSLSDKLMDYVREHVHDVPQQLVLTRLSGSSVCECSRRAEVFCTCYTAVCMARWVSPCADCAESLPYRVRERYEVFRKDGSCCECDGGGCPPVKVIARRTGSVSVSGAVRHCFCDRAISGGQDLSSAPRDAKVYVEWEPLTGDSEISRLCKEETE
ncbi:hypothetical protein LX36DRAFT_664991 [Colletotrichum falcatum]|nr:hypothetical protein LX36DRAFT_664991 [Colletotrichum falcatum]